ncbi:MAG: calcium/proton exchanger [Cyanobacteria bacterium]|nr:calcium/proton exchanger [Cyanobacteriota bacterium]
MDILTVMLALVPLPIIANLLGWSPVAIFATSCLGIIPLAGFMGKATEHLSEHVGPGRGALLNAFFGNACEFILAVSALNAGLIDVVKASITGSIMGNVLLVLGASMFAGGLRNRTQTFNRTAASTSATLLALAAIGLLMPAVMKGVSKISDTTGEHISIAISIVLSFVYLASLLFSLKTHKQLYGALVGAEGEHAIGVDMWSQKKSITILLFATIAVATLAQFLVGAVEQTGRALGMSELFVGVILVAIIGNAAENSSAVLMAMKNRMDLAINIALGSSTQLALLIAPVLVFIGWFIHKPMNLMFSEAEIVAVIVAVVALKFVATDGESNWLEGLMLLAVYAILGATFYYL